MRAVAVLFLCGSAAHAASITSGPYLVDATPEAFTVAYDTDAPARGLVVVEGGGTLAETAGTHHESRVVGLTAQKRYPYQVRLDGETVARGEARTLPARDPFTFVVYGDTRQGGAVEQALAERIRAESPDFVVHTGDLVRKGDDEAAWRDFFAGERSLLSSVPFFAALGNHELWGDVTGEYARRYFPSFRERRYYAFDAGGSRFIFLDGNQPDDLQQTAWLEKELETAKDARHVFVVEHQPAFSLGDHCGAATAQLEWVKLFERHRVRAVFAGHDHAYERMERNGVRYFVSGGGGAPLYGEQPCADLDRAARRVYAEEYHYLRVHVAGDRVEVTAVRADPAGPPIDAVTLTPGDAFIAEGPPLESQSSFFDRFHRQLYRNRPWTYAAGALVLLFLVARMLRRRR